MTNGVSADGNQDLCIISTHRRFSITIVQLAQPIMFAMTHCVMT